MENLSIITIGIIGCIIGSLLGVFIKPKPNFIFQLLAFCAGVMLAISFFNLIPHSIQESSLIITIIGLVIGAGLMYLADKIIPHYHANNTEINPQCDLKRTSIYLIIGIFLHHFPEGMAMAIGGASAYKAGLIIALSISIHDIPEGICTSAPYYLCTRKRLKSFLLSISTIIPVIAGFYLAHFLFHFISPAISGLITAITAGLMIYMSIDELIPTACSGFADNNKKKTAVILLLGVALVLIINLW